MKKLIWIASGALSVLTMAAPTGFTRQHRHLNTPVTVGGIPVRAGDIDVFVPGETLARGVLSQQHGVQGLELPADSELTMESPGRLATVELPRQSNAALADNVFRGGETLRFGYGKYLAKFRGRIAYRTSFPGVGLSDPALANEVLATCHGYLPGDTRPQNWFCNFQLILSSTLDHKFGTALVTLPRATRIGFTKYGIDTLTLPEDTVLFGLPVSAATSIRVNRWTKGGPPSIVSLRLAHNAEYQGIPISTLQDVEFYEAGVDGLPRLAAFVPQGDLILSAAGQKVVVAPLQRVHLNRDGSLHYGNLASAQNVSGMLIPENALVFFGDNANSPVSSIGLAPSTSIRIRGITYGPSSSDRTLFIDFDARGNVTRVRGS